MTKVDKANFKDDLGRYIVQGLFLEDRYNTDLAVFTYDGEDKVYKGKTYVSLKRLYLEHGDPLEYDFATTHLFDWAHWQRLTRNKSIAAHIDTWREELSLKIMSDGVQSLLELGTEGKSYQAAKYLSEAGWIKNERGRPSKDEVEGELRRRADADAEFNDDFKLLNLHKDK